MCNPGDLWVHILKGIYFPQDHFLKARKGGRVSWAWSSILEGRDFLAKNLCWAIGDGRDINPGLLGFGLISKPPWEAFEGLSIAECIANGRWDLSMVEDWLTKQELDAIQKIHVPRATKKDSLKWVGATVQKIYFMSPLN